MAGCKWQKTQVPSRREPAPSRPQWQLFVQRGVRGGGDAYNLDEAIVLARALVRNDARQAAFDVLALNVDS